MNARELADLIERGIPYECGNGETSKLIIRALRLLADAEANDGETPQTDDFAEQDFVLETIRLHPKILARIKAWADHARRLERERNGLAARVRELEPDAERYRFLKDGLWDDYLTGVIEMRKDAIWDAAIDAARSK